MCYILSAEPNPEPAALESWETMASDEERGKAAWW